MTGGNNREEGIYFSLALIFPDSHPSLAMSPSANRPGRNHVTLRIALSTVDTVETLSSSSCSYAATSCDMVVGDKEKHCEMEMSGVGITGAASPRR